MTNNASYCIIVGLGTIQVLRNAMVYSSGYFNVTKLYGSTLLALQGGGWVTIYQKKASRNTRRAPRPLVNLWLIR